MKTILFKPFERYSEKTLLIVGVVLTFIGSFLGYWMNARFSAVLDLHFADNVQFLKPFFDNLLNIFSLTLFLFVAGKYGNKKTRVVDILITVMIARAPIYLLSLSNIGNYLSENIKKLSKHITPDSLGNIPPLDLIAIALIFVLLTILALIWYIALLYNGYKTASHAKGTKPIVLFIIALILAEILSTILIYTLN